jgi:hypothetical protein
MKQIIVENLTKTFHIAERQHGFSGAIKGLFIVVIEMLRHWQV